MKRRPSITIVAVTTTQLIRGDFNGRADAPPLLRTVPRGPGAQIPEAVRAALALGGRAASRVLVLCEDFWSQCVTLPAAQSDGLSPRETAEALGFEIEPFSNMSPINSEVGFRVARQNDGTNLYWVVECSRDELAAIRDVVGKAGGRLSAVSHPGALPRPLGEADPTRPWRRVEQWKRGLLSIRAAAGQIAVQSIAPAQLRADAPASAEYVEMFLGNAGDMALAAAGEVAPRPSFALADEAHLRLWLQAWARCFDEAPAASALVHPPPAVTPAHRYVLAGVAIAALAAAVCLAHWRWAAVQRDRLRAALGSIQESVDRIVQLEKKNAEAKLAVVHLQQEQRDREEFSQLFAQRRRSVPCLLRALAKVRPADVVLQAIRDEGRGCLLISGLALTAGGADELTLQLSEALRGTGWRVHTLQRLAQGLLGNGGPWRFDMRVDLGETAAAAERPGEGAAP